MNFLAGGRGCHSMPRISCKVTLNAGCCSAFSRSNLRGTHYFAIGLPKPFYELIKISRKCFIRKKIRVSFCRRLCFFCFLLYPGDLSLCNTWDQVFFSAGFMSSLLQMDAWPLWPFLPHARCHTSPSTGSTKCTENKSATFALMRLPSVLQKIQSRTK